MLTVICGEDIASARQKLLQLKQQYREKGYSIQYVSIGDLPEVYKNSKGVVDLFGQESVYFVDKISSKYKGRSKTDFKEMVKELSKNNAIQVVDWEEGMSAYNLSGLKRISTAFDEHKPSRNIFELLDACYPGNLKQFLSLLEIVHTSQDMMFIYTLLWRHVRKLILATEGEYEKGTQAWQKTRITQQASTWKQQTLLRFYEGLIRIDQGMKTSTSTFDLKESIEILACYYLR